MAERIQWIKDHVVISIYTVISSVLIILFLFSLIISENEKDSDAVQSLEQLFEETDESTTEKTVISDDSIDQTEAVDKVVIELKGAVETPGVYELSAGDRLVDAIEVAGGLSGNADDRTVNKALILTDQMMIYIPKKGEEVTPVFNIETENTDQKTSEKIDINKVEAVKLMELNGIGEAKAQSIIEYREKEGPFNSIEEIKEVSGIGEKIFEAIKNEITVD